MLISMSHPQLLRKSISHLSDDSTQCMPTLYSTEYARSFIYFWHERRPRNWLPHLLSQYHDALSMSAKGQSLYSKFRDHCVMSHPGYEMVRPGKLCSSERSQWHQHMNCASRNAMRSADLVIAIVQRIVDWPQLPVIDLHTEDLSQQY